MVITGVNGSLIVFMPGQGKVMLGWQAVGLLVLVTSAFVLDRELAAASSNVRVMWATLPMPAPLISNVSRLDGETTSAEMSGV